ncbi:hypothetical protein Syun_012630 [Stephania yunnanensis]|uniref:Thioredoxin-like fold domain-containing protein n=1 Tax=Stephania yunnanensis TaxID=152371 RepID=A0AAP0PJ51_9MAGN
MDVDVPPLIETFSLMGSYEVDAIDIINESLDQIPYVEYGEYVAYNNEKGGVIESLKEDGLVDLDSGHPSYDAVEWRAIVRSWLTDAAMYELWIGSDGARHIRYISLISHGLLERFSTISKLEALTLRTKLLEHSNLVRYTENFKAEFLKAGSSSSIPRSPYEPSSSFTPKRGTPPNWGKRRVMGTKPKSKPKREKTEEEKTFKRRAKYFVATQQIAILVFMYLLGGSDEVNLDVDDDDGMNYDD